MRRRTLCRQRFGHAVVTQQGVDLRVAATEGAEGFDGGTGAADSENFALEASSGLGIQQVAAVLFGGFFKGGEGVRREHFRPFVAVIACGITASENVREAVREAVPFG